MDMIKRELYLNQLSSAVARSPVTAILGPRQCGKTTLAHMFAADKKTTFFDLESQPDLRRLENPEYVLGSLKGVVVLDEIQVRPELFSVLRVLVDRPQTKARFLILGSVSPHIIKNVSETLAGRVEFVELAGFDQQETGPEKQETLWVRGGFPLSFLAAADADSLAWREGFIRTFLERDIPQLGIKVPAPAMRRFWTMLAHYHGQTWNASVLARSLGVSDKTVRTYLDILTGTFMIRQLQPWYENLKKRQIRAPKIYFRDSGLLHSLLTVTDVHSLMGHPKAGASWEGFALEQFLRLIAPAEAFFWATHNGAELDLLFMDQGQRYGVEIKFNEAPKITRSMQIAIDDLGLSHLWVICPGREIYVLDEKITVCPLERIMDIAESLKKQ